VNLARTVPDQSWLDPRNKALLDFTSSYGKVTQPSTPTVKTNIIHADLERDEYLTSRVYAFGVGDWDHNYSQGLDLQQSYGGGLGWTLLKTDTEELSVRAGMDYVRQEFTNSTSQNLIGSMFAESYNRDFPHSIVFTESIKIMPAWNDPNAYSVLGNATLALPVYKRFNLTLSAIDSFLNNPPPGFKKNSFQFITGLTYTVR
jgi:putative salt-induced outer membrane protein YdiY